MGTRGGEEHWPAVRTAMLRNALTVRPETPIRFATGLMVASNLTTLPVVDADGRLVGLVNDADVIGYVLGRAGGIVTAPPTREQGSVAELMSPPIVTVDDEGPVLDVAVTLAHSRLSRLVVTHRGHVVGTIGRMEVLAALLEHVGWTELEDVPSDHSDAGELSAPVAGGS